MLDYDTMSVHDLLLRAAQDGMQGFLHEQYPELCELSDIESALRRAVLREATVGKVTVVTTEHFDEITRPEDPDRIVTMSEQLICQAWVPEGEYYLVKKEVK